MQWLGFQPLPGLSSSHLQTVLGAYLPSGSEPVSDKQLIVLGDGDFIVCDISTPNNWQASNQTVVLVHGLGGSSRSKYMVRLARKFFLDGYKVVRVNLRGCGSGEGLSSLPYNAGTSDDLKTLLYSLKDVNNDSPITLVGFSLGANIVLKLAGSLGQKSAELVRAFIAICAPLDLAQTVASIQQKKYSLYHFYYLRKILRQATPWIEQKIGSIYEFDDRITAPLWGYSGADMYYKACSSLQFLPKITHNCRLLFAQDDPFVCTTLLDSIALHPKVQVYKTRYGGHMGFLGKTATKDQFFWLDQQLKEWIKS